MDQHDHYSQPAPNSALTAQEREARVYLKKLFREQQIRSKLGMRLFKAESRGEWALVEATRQELHELDARGAHQHHPITTTAPHDDDDDPDPQKVLAGRCIEQVYQAMQKTWRESSETDSNHLPTNQNDHCPHPRARKNHANPQYTPRHVKERRLEESQRLLQSMSKGTQTLSEFRNPEALRGYTRQKFMERANLVVRSLRRLQRRAVPQQHPSELNLSTTSSSTDIHQSMLERLWQVRSVCSVGCGPGGETVGVVAFLQSHQPRAAAAGHSEQDESLVLDRILFCDWALSDWSPMLESVREYLVEQQRIVGQVNMATCDVRVSLRDSARSTAEVPSTHGSDNLQSESAGSTVDIGLLQALTFSSISSSNSYLPRHQLVVVSFLLSETRGQWHVFFDDLVDMSPTGTLFLLTDPTAWQLHLFRQRYEFFDRLQPRRRMEFCWLDSSMYRPELQVLPARLSSAVLLAMVVSTLAENRAPES